MILGVSARTLHSRAYSALSGKCHSHAGRTQLHNIYTAPCIARILIKCALLVWSRIDFIIDQDHPKQYSTTPSSRMMQSTFHKTALSSRSTDGGVSSTVISQILILGSLILVVASCGMIVLQAKRARILQQSKFQTMRLANDNPRADQAGYGSEGLDDVEALKGKVETNTSPCHFSGPLRQTEEFLNPGLRQPAPAHVNGKDMRAPNSSLSSYTA